VLGEEAELRAALTNLLDNALKFTPEGGRISLGFRQEDGVAVLWVEDTGIGIPEADLPLLFQRFHRGRNAAAYPGSGLGLAIVKAIAERHGGQVQAERAEPGARFILRLPLSSCE
jgi:signal transduction histidine kinase